MLDKVMVAIWPVDGVAKGERHHMSLNADNFHKWRLTRHV